ncbi:MAG: tRNA (N(6)-L-threonylcarbamoyladenosine(37)-C(2))-methylthiotransferase MtaB [Candidatus Omnitrophota bacterium]
MEKTVSFYTLGCRLNQSETASLQNLFEESGYRLVDGDEPAELTVINTCTVTQGGDADTRRLVNKINRINPDARIALIGCQAQTQKEKLAELPNVCLIVGNERKMDLVDIVHEIDLCEECQVITPTIRRESFTMPIKKIDRGHTRANLKIQDGCDFFCSYCEIPYARGRARSRVFEDVLLEAKALAASGHKEIVLTGINVGLYKHENKTLLHILDALEKTDGLARVRISSIEHTTVPIELIQRMGTTKLCRFLHIPLQSGSDQILKAMDRKYGAQEFADFIVKAYQMVPEICIGTDLLVGFPGESKEQFEETYRFVEHLPVAYMHVFSYSKRHLARSKNLKDEVPAEKIKDRSQRLRDLSKSKRTAFLRGLIGTTQNVLFEEKRQDEWIGYTDHFVRVKYKCDKNIQNQIIPVKMKVSEFPFMKGIKNE